jgi:hypothetical protein
MEKRQKAVDGRKQLAELRVVQRNLVFVIGLSPRLADAEMLKKHEYFGKFGKIHKIVVNSSNIYPGPQVLCLSVCLSVNGIICETLSVCLSVNGIICEKLSVCLLLLLCLYVCLFVCPSIVLYLKCLCLPVCLSMVLYVKNCLSVCCCCYVSMSVSLSVRQLYYI